MAGPEWQLETRYCTQPAAKEGVGFVLLILGSVGRDDILEFLPIRQRKL